MKFQNEKAALQSEHRKRIKAVKKVLGDQTTTAYKLKEKVKDLENNEAKLTDATVQVTVSMVQVHDVVV